MAPVTQIGVALRATASHIEGTLGLVQSAFVSRYAVERDSGLRELVSQYWNTHGDSQEAVQHAQNVPAEVLNEQRATARLAAKNIWLETETSLLQREAGN